MGAASKLEEPGWSGEWVGQKDLSVTASTYTHVMADETDLNYSALLAGQG